jgi:hypothetical protein
MVFFPVDCLKIVERSARSQSFQIPLKVFRSPPFFSAVDYLQTFTQRAIKFFNPISEFCD